MVVNELSTHHIRIARDRGRLWIDDVTICLRTPPPRRDMSRAIPWLP
jgi:hypothetical protein